MVFPFPSKGPSPGENDLGLGLQGRGQEGINPGQGNELIVALTR